MSNDTREALAAKLRSYVPDVVEASNSGDLRYVRLTVAEVMETLAALTEQPAAQPVAHFLNNAADGEPPHYAQVAAEFIGTKGVIPLYAQPAAPAQAEQWSRKMAALESTSESDPGVGAGAHLAAPAQEEEEERHCMNCAEFGECRPNNLHGCGYEPPAAAPAQEPAPNDWRLPHDLKAGHVTFRKGVHCRSLVMRMESLYRQAFPDAADLTDEQKAENLAALRSCARAAAQEPQRPTQGDGIPYVGTFVFDDETQQETEEIGSLQPQAAEAKEITPEDLWVAYTRVRNKRGREAARNLRREFGVSLCTDLKPKQWAEFIATAERRLDGWIKWSGGKRPVGKDVRVEVRFRDNATAVATESDHWVWQHDGSSGDIVEYRVIK